MIGPMTLAPGTHTLGPDSGSLEIHTFRDGVAQKVGHDLIIDVGGWQGTTEVDSEGHLTSVSFTADTKSLTVKEGLHGLKPLSDKDRADILGSINDKVLLGQDVSFESSAVQDAGGLTILGELTIVGSRRPASFELQLAGDGRIQGKLPVVQTEFGIKPYRGLMGALKVRDEVEIAVNVQLPTS